MGPAPAARTILLCHRSTRTVPGPLTGLCGRPLIRHVLDAAGAGVKRLTVVGADDETIEYLKENPGTKNATFRDGTLRDALADGDDVPPVTVILRSDMPLLTRETVQSLTGSIDTVARHGSAWAFDTTALGHALAETDETGDADAILEGAAKVLEAAGATIAATDADPAEALTVTGQLALAEARRLLRDRILARWMAEGVTVVDPATTWVDADVVLTSGVTLLRNTELCGGTTIGADCTIGPDTTLVATRVGAGTRIRSSTCENVRIGPENNVGPYSYLRGGTASGRKVIMGSHVHIKASEIGAGSSVPHFAYLGDLTVGERSNISGFSGTVNFDGQRTHRTTVGDDVMIGAGTILVAPIEVGGGAYTAAGALLTKDVPPGALALTRIRQEHIEGWVESVMPDSAAARTARAANDNNERE